MKNINIFIAILAVSAMTFTGCIKETFPQGGSATSEQIGASSSALEASLNGIPASMVQGYYVYGEQVDETDMAFPQFMISMTEMLGDIYPLGTNVGYDWYRQYNIFNRGYSETGENAYLSWFTLYKFIKSSNDIIATVNIDDPAVSDLIKGYAGVAYACRAFDYYMLTVLFEPAENIYTDCSKVLGLTVPFVTEATTGEMAKNNPRATHADMIKFIISDCTKAEACLKNFTPSSGLYPSLAVVYGIMAKTYMWDKDYANAAKYARMAIDTFGGTPVTKAQWLDEKTGFNTANQAWMWYGHYSAETMSNLCNFTGWMAGDADWGYSSLTFPSIDKSLYDKIATTDFRKYTFVDPSLSYKYTTPNTKLDLKKHPLLSLKFRCGNGDCETYSVGAAVDVPFMRVEEMYLIEAEAVGASQGLSQGVALLNKFMQTYRDPDYDCKAATVRDFQLEVLTQERIEFWGEGWGLPNAKRLRPGTIQNYTGTNAPSNLFKINCKDVKPSWTVCIPISEVQANAALADQKNPDPTASVVGPTPIGEYAPGKN